MTFGWGTEREKILRGTRISPEKKLKGMRLLNELADSVLTDLQKAARRRLRKEA